jgi:hypothetical protein
MPSSNSSGTQAATVTSEHTLATITTVGTFVLYVDMNALALGDELILRAKVKVTSGGTTRLAYAGTYKNVQENLVAISIPIASVNEVVFTLHQAAGTSRSFPWEIVEL